MPKKEPMVSSRVIETMDATCYRWVIEFYTPSRKLLPTELFNGTYEQANRLANRLAEERIEYKNATKIVLVRKGEC